MLHLQCAAVFCLSCSRSSKRLVQLEAAAPRPEGHPPCRRCGRSSSRPCFSVWGLRRGTAASLSPPGSFWCTPSWGESCERGVTKHDYRLTQQLFSLFYDVIVLIFVTLECGIQQGKIKLCKIIVPYTYIKNGKFYNIKALGSKVCCIFLCGCSLYAFIGFLWVPWIKTHIPFLTFPSCPYIPLQTYWLHLTFSPITTTNCNVLLGFFVTD